jgi:lauroyl/myristoyl acyltransferase
MGVAAVVSVMPQKARHRMGTLIGDYLYRNSPKRHKYASANLKQVYPDATIAEINEKVRTHLHWYGRGLIDYSLFFFGSKKRLLSMVSVSGEDSLLNAVKHDKSVILLLTHSVMLEFAAIALASKGLHSFGSYKRSNNPVLDWVIARSRCRFVDFVVSREEGLRPLIKAIQSKRVMIFLPDEDLGLKSGVFAPFFGRQKATLTTPARLCKLGKAFAVVGFVEFDVASKSYRLNLQEMPDNYPLGDAEQDATVMNQVFQSLISQQPEQYMWLMRLFRTTQADDKPLY